MIILILISLFVLDWQLKKYSEKKWKYKELNFFNKKLNFCYQKNYGIAFDYLENKIKLIIISNIIYLTYLIYFYVDNINYRGALSLIITGGLGNLSDRIKRGYVIDYVYLNIKKFPVFNLSDVYILIGALLIIHKELLK